MDNDETPTPENEIIFIIDDVLKDGIMYYDSFIKRSKTKQQLEGYTGLKRALENANKQIVKLGIRNGLKSLKLYQKSIKDKLKTKQSTNQSFDAGLYRGYTEAINKIEELAWPLFEGKGFTKDFQKEFEADTNAFDLEECQNCGRKWSAWTTDTLEYCKSCDETICNHCKTEDDCEWCFKSGAVERKSAEENQLKKAYNKGLKRLEDIGWEVNERQFTMDAVYAGLEESHTWEISASNEMLERYPDGGNLNQKAVREQVYESLKQAGWDIDFDVSMLGQGFTEFHMGSTVPSGIDRGYEDNFENIGIINEAESFAAEGNKMKAAILRGIQAAIREEYVEFDGKADIAATVNMILRELGQLEGDTPVEMLDVGSAPAMRIDPYDVVAAMARAANQMAKINEESMVCWDMEDMFLDSNTKRLGWGLQSIFGIHALKAKVDGEDAWRVSGYPQAIETWFMLYNSLRINLQKEIKKVKKADKEAFYQAFALHIRENPNVKKMIKKNSKNREMAKELSKTCFPEPESKKWVPVEEVVASKAKRLSNVLNPFASETFNNTNQSNKGMDRLAKRKSGRINSGDVKVLTIGVLIGAFGSLFGNFLTKKYLGPSVIVTTDDDDDDNSNAESDSSSTIKESDLISFSQKNRFIQTN